MSVAGLLLMERYVAMVARIIANPEAVAVFQATERAVEREVRGVHVRRLALNLRRVRDRLAEGT